MVVGREEQTVKSRTCVNSLNLEAMDSLSMSRKLTLLVSFLALVSCGGCEGLRKRRSPEYNQERADELRRLDPADLAELLKDTPWALIAIKDYSAQKRGGGGSGSTSTNFVPRLGRSSAFSEFTPRLGRSDVSQVDDDDDDAEWDGSTTFVPRLGRRSGGKGGRGRDDDRQQDGGASAKFSPRLGRGDGGHFSPRLGRAQARV